MTINIIPEAGNLTEVGILLKDYTTTAVLLLDKLNEFNLGKKISGVDEINPIITHLMTVANKLEQQKQIKAKALIKDLDKLINWPHVGQITFKKAKKIVYNALDKISDKQHQLINK